MQLAELASRLGCRLDGDGAIEIGRVAGLDDAGPGDVTFLANPKYTAKLATTKASAAIVDPATPDAPCATLRTPQVYLAFAEAVTLLAPRVAIPAGISALASVDPTAEIGAGVSVGPFAVIAAGARIGARTTLYPHVVIGAGAIVGADCVLHAQVSVRDGVILGDRVVLQDAAVIGSDGFGFARRPDGTHQKIPQIGRVVVEDDVEIGAHSAVDRPAIGETRIAAGTKIDNLVHVAHGVRVGRNVLMAAQVGIAGSTVIDDNVILAGQVGVIDHVHVGKGVVANAKTAVMSDIDEGLRVAGIPATGVQAWRRSSVIIRRLPELREQIGRLDARLAALEVAVEKS